MGGVDVAVLENGVAKKQTADAQPAPARPKSPKKKTSKASKKTPESLGRPDALLGKRYTHRTRAEWGVGTVVDGAENALVLSWSDGTQRRTARTYMDHLVEVP
jgi:hypothetical protein